MSFRTGLHESRALRPSAHPGTRIRSTRGRARALGAAIDWKRNSDAVAVSATCHVTDVTHTKVEEDLYEMRESETINIEESADEVGEVVEGQ